MVRSHGTADFASMRSCFLFSFFAKTATYRNSSTNTFVPTASKGSRSFEHNWK